MCIIQYTSKATSQTRVHEVACLYLNRVKLFSKLLNIKHLPPPIARQNLTIQRIVKQSDRMYSVCINHFNCKDTKNYLNFQIFLWFHFPVAAVAAADENYMWKFGDMAFDGSCCHAL